MTRKLRCRRCLAAGLLFSALLHGAATVWLSARPAATARPDVRITELDLAIFAAAGPAPVTLAAGDPETEAAPAEPPPEPEPSIADTTEPPVVPEPEPVSEPEPDPKPEPALEPEPEAPIPALAEVEPVPEQAAQPPRPKPRPQAKRPARKPQPKAVAERKPDPIERTPSPPALAAKPSDGTSKGGQVIKAGDSRDSGARASSARRDAEQAYLAELQRAIGRYQRFPDEARRRRKTGVATVAFVVTADGRIREVRLHKTSGEASLDDAALKALQRLNRFKPIPEVIGRRTWSMRVPIRFDLR